MSKSEISTRPFGRYKNTLKRKRGHKTSSDIEMQSESGSINWSESMSGKIKRLT